MRLHIHKYKITKREFFEAEHGIINGYFYKKCVRCGKVIRDTVVPLYSLKKTEVIKEV